MTGESSAARLLRSAAFGSVPDIAEREVVRAAAASPRCAWLAAVVLGARGRYAAATTLLGPLRTSGDRLLASLAGATLAAHRRQLGGHAAALPLDGMALRVATSLPANVLTNLPTNAVPDEDGIDPAGALADALLGLAADNLALGRLSAARRLIARATGIPAGWRTTVRAGWVGAEVALASGNAPAAVPCAERAAKVAAHRGAVRHAVKSDLVLGAALAATGDPANRERATRLVTDALKVAKQNLFHSLVWPGLLLAADLETINSDWSRSRVTLEFHSVLSATDPQGRRLARNSAWVPALDHD